MMTSRNVSKVKSLNLLLDNYNQTSMTRREVGVWLLLLGRLQEAPPSKVCNDDDDDDNYNDDDDDDPQAAGERAQQQGLTLSGLCSLPLCLFFLLFFLFFLGGRVLPSVVCAVFLFFLC